MLFNSPFFCSFWGSASSSLVQLLPTALNKLCSVCTISMQICPLVQSFLRPVNQTLESHHQGHMLAMCSPGCVNNLIHGFFLGFQWRTLKCFLQNSFRVRDISVTLKYLMKSTFLYSFLKLQITHFSMNDGRGVMFLKRNLIFMESYLASVSPTKAGGCVGHCPSEKDSL